MFANVVSARAPQLIFSVCVCALGGYTTGRRGLRIHQSKVGADTVGNGVLWKGRRIERGGFAGTPWVGWLLGEDAVSRKAAWRE